MKPRALVETLLAKLPLTGLNTDLASTLKLGDYHGFSEFGAQLTSRLASATGRSLSGVTLSRFSGLLASTNLTRQRSSAPLYCPCCVGDLPESTLPVGQLVWEVQCVTACPIHRVKLRSEKVCGAPASEHLPLARRPKMSGVCKQCGSVGFKCIQDPLEAASASEVWVAEQVGRLVALSDAEVETFSAEKLRSGLAEMVKEVYNDSVVAASQGAGLSRASVSTWIRGVFAPGLPWLLQLCYHARADVVALLGGKYKALKLDAEDKARSRTNVVERTYSKADKTPSELKELLIDAALEDEPPSVAEFAARHGLHVDSPRHRFPDETRKLVAAHKRRLEVEQKVRVTEAAVAYKMAALALRRAGKRVHEKSLQQEAGLVAFSQNPLRRRALDAVLSEFRPPQADSATGT
jgi:hypothetical protein